MKISQSSFALILLILPHISVAAIDDVNGAFGLMFGKPVPKGTLCKLSGVHLTSDCYLTPPTPFVSFDSYRVNTAMLGGDRVIYEIFGYRNMRDKYNQCLKEAEYIAGKLSDKYKIQLNKEPVRDILKPTKQGGTMWRSPNKEHSKSVYVICRKVIPGLIDENKAYYQLFIVYKDVSIHNKAVMEKINNQDKVDLTNIKNSDDSGL